MKLLNPINLADIEQDSLDLSSSEDITAAIDRFEKLLNTDLKYSDSFKKMKASLGSSGNSWGINDRESKSNISEDVSSDNDEEDKCSTENTSNPSIRVTESESQNEDEKLLLQCLSSTNFSFTQYFDKVDTEEEQNIKRVRVIEKIKQM